MSTQTQVSFNPPTLNTDGSTITETLTYNVYIDTVNPPVKVFPIPATVLPVAGLLTVTFAQLGFTPVKGTDYFASVTATDADGTSVMATDFAFAYSVTPLPPTGFKVS
jgi:hypothetical protein